MSRNKLGAAKKASISRFVNYGIILIAYLVLRLLIGQGAVSKIGRAHV